MAEYIDKADIYELFKGTNGIIRLHVAEVDQIPAADVVPKEYHEQCLEIEIQKRLAIEPKRGHWVGLEYDGYADGNPVYDLWECSECGNEERGEDVPETHPFCNWCGARMDGAG